MTSCLWTNYETWFPQPIFTVLLLAFLARGLQTSSRHNPNQFSYHQLTPRYWPTLQTLPPSPQQQTIFISTCSMCSPTRIKYPKWLISPYSSFSLSLPTIFPDFPVIRSNFQETKAEALLCRSVYIAMTISCFFVFEQNGLEKKSYAMAPWIPGNGCFKNIFRFFPRFKFGCVVVKENRFEFIIGPVAWSVDFGN